jgi:hypothetical protein
MQNEFEEEDFDDFGPMQMATMVDEINIDTIQVKNHFNRRLRDHCDAIAAIKWHRSQMVAANDGKPLSDIQVQELEEYAGRVYSAKGLA